MYRFSENRFFCNFGGGYIRNFSNFVDFRSENVEIISYPHNMLRFRQEFGNFLKYNLGYEITNCLTKSQLPWMIN